MTRYHFVSADGSRGKIKRGKPEDLIVWMWNMIQMGLRYEYIGCTENHIDEPKILDGDPIDEFQNSWWLYTVEDGIPYRYD